MRTIEQTIKTIEQYHGLPHLGIAVWDEEEKQEYLAWLRRNEGQTASF